MDLKSHLRGETDVADQNTKAHGVYITKSPDHIFLVSMEGIRSQNSEPLVKVRVVPVPRKDSDFFLTFATSCVDILIGGGAKGVAGAAGAAGATGTSKTKGKILTHVASLDHGKNCSVTDLLPNKKGTNQMFLSTLALCVQTIGVERVQLIDASNFMCGDMIVDLYIHNLLVHGETWYERKYGAKPEDSQDALSKAKEALGQTVSAPFSDYLVKSTENSIFKSIIRTHTGVTSWNRLFASINGADGGCEFFEYDLLKTIAEYFHIPDVQHWDVSSLLETNLKQYLVSYKKIY